MTVHATPGAAADELDFTRFGRSLWRARLLLLIVPLLAAALAWVATSRAPVRYRATVSMAALTPWAAPVDPAGIAALRGAAAGMPAESAAGQAPAKAVSVDAPGEGNTFAVHVIDATADGAIRAANAVGASMSARLRDMRQSSQRAIADTGEEAVEAARRRFKSAAEAMAQFLGSAGLRVDHGEPVRLDGRPVTTDVRTRFAELRAEERAASSSYTQALLWQQDMRRQAGARIPDVVLLQPATSAGKIGPWPMRAAAIAAIVALFATAGACLAWDALRSSWRPAPPVPSTERM